MMRINDYWKKVIELGPHPDLFGSGRFTIHHCHSGSVSDCGIHRGIGQKPSDWLVICLPESLHVLSKNGIDYGKGVRSWEKEFCPQMSALIWTADELGIDVFDKAGLDGNLVRSNWIDLSSEVA